MKLLSLIIGLTMATSAAAEIPFVIAERGSFRFEGTVAHDGTTLCEIKQDVTDARGYFQLTDCVLDLSKLSGLQISGEFAGNNASGSFEASYTFVDISPWTSVLRDESLGFGTRLERYRDGIAKLDPALAEEFKIRTPDIADGDVIAAIRADIGTDLPAELEAFISHDVSIYDNSYIGPAYMARWPQIPRTWLNMTEWERRGGVPETALPAEGSDLRAWYDRVRVVYEYVGDGVAPIVWDPAAAEGQPAFFWLHEDDRSISPFEYLAGTPVNALDALIAPLDWTRNWENYEDESWVYAAIQQTGVDADDSSLIVVDKSNPAGFLSIDFQQGSRVPLFRKVEPYVAFHNQSWWER